VVFQEDISLLLLAPISGHCIAIALLHLLIQHFLPPEQTTTYVASVARHTRTVQANQKVQLHICIPFPQATPLSHVHVHVHVHVQYVIQGAHVCIVYAH